MSKIERYTGNLRAFGSNAQGLERTLFGETTQADDLTSQVTNSFLRGWGIVGPSENPSMEDFNAAMYTMSQFIAYLHQMGIPEWDALQEYYSGSICVRAGETYSSLVNGNVGSAPPSVKWTPVLTTKNGLENLGLSDVAHLPQLTGVVGTSRNAKMSVTTASATATFTADELIVQAALGGRQYKLSSFSKTINLATTGAGGMDTGTVPATGYVALYAIYNPTSGASALLAVNATSARAPEVYGGSNMPSGYTASALVSVWRVASSQFVIGFQRGRHISIPLSQVYATATGVTSIGGVSFAPMVPINAVSISAYLTLYQTTTSVGVELSLYSSLSGIGQLRANASVSGATSVSIANGVLEVVDAQALYFNMASTASGSYAISATGYSI
ncbi:tail fiber protein [Yersinia frederiksenii]|nr:tail fiber protein [Yersinia frederiksenii]